MNRVKADKRGLKVIKPCRALILSGDPEPPEYITKSLALLKKQHMLVRYRF